MRKPLALVLSLMIVALGPPPSRSRAQPAATQPDDFEPRYRTVARWTGTIKMRIQNYATREPGGAFGTALSGFNSVEDSTAQVVVREEADEVDGAERTVVESITWSSKVGDLYYQNKDGSRVNAGPGGSGGGGYSEAELAGEPAPPSEHDAEHEAEQRRAIDEVARVLTRLESELGQAQAAARAWNELATPDERAAAETANAALQAVLRAQTSGHGADPNAAYDAYGKAEQALSELTQERLARASDDFTKQVEALSKVFQSGDGKKIAEASERLQRLQKDYDQRYRTLQEAADAARQVRSLTEQIASSKLQLYQLRRNLWQARNRRNPLAQAHIIYTRAPDTGRPTDVSLDFSVERGGEKPLMTFPVEVLPLELKGFDVNTAAQPDVRQWKSSAGRASVRGAVPEDGPIVLTDREDSKKGEPGLIGGGERKVEIVFNREAEKEPVELVITPHGYDEWMPEGGEDVETPGNGITVTAELRTPQGGTSPVPAKRIRFELVDVSSEPGVALNWPPKDEPLAGRDLKIDQRQNPNLRVTNEDGSKAQTPEGEQVTTATALVSAYDFGAFGKLRVTADLVDGRTVYGHLSGEPQRQLVLLPKRRDDSRAAEAWRQRAGAAQMSDDADEESSSAKDNQPGDGLSVYEEYRGFFENGRHLRTDPRRKDLFVRDEIGNQPTMGGIAVFMWATDLDVHYELRKDELHESRVININHKSANRVKQHALLMKRGELASEWMGGQAVGGPGNPGKVTEIRIAPHQGRWWHGAARKQSYAGLVAHELLHGVNVWHHGDKDIGKVQWARGTEASGKPVVLETRLDENGRPRDSGTPVRIFAESGTEYAPGNARFDSPRKVWVASVNGQHSGDEQCLMRYNCAQAYDSGVTSVVPRRYWRDRPDESDGFELCTRPDGTGVNAPSTRPRPRYGKASPGRGDCTHQIQVSDEFPALERN